MKVIFLDFDGCINSESSFLYHRLTVHSNENYRVSNPNPMSVTFIDYLLYVTGAKLVISSSWRGGTLESIQETLKTEFNLKRTNRVIGQTPRLWDEKDSRRGVEIQHWLDRNKVESYIIIDDENDMLESQKSFLVNTDFAHGFTNRDLYKAANLLGCEADEMLVHNSEKLIESFLFGVDYFKD